MSGLIKLIRWILGFVSFKASGKFSERFINVTSKNGIYVWDILPEDKSIKGQMYVSDYKKIRPYAKKSKVRLKITKRTGLPFFIQKNKTRIGAVIGVICFFAIIFVMSKFIWVININGNEEISSIEIMQVLKNNGLKTGTYINSIDINRVKSGLLLEIPDIGWAAINLQGSTADVEIKEKAKQPQVIDINTPCNVKAKKDGQIVSIEAQRGFTVVQTGSGVVRGQLLVSGIIEDVFGGNSFVHANAKILAQTYYEKEFSTPAKTKLNVFNDDIAVRYSADILNFCFPVSVDSQPESYKSYYKTFSVLLNNTVLPVKCKQEFLQGIEEKEIKFNNDTAKQAMLKEAALFEVFELQNCSVAEREIKETSQNEKFILKVHYTCTEDIAMEEELIVN